jgi:GGDEF domain-containing protein
MSETADGYRLLARLRGLERQLRRLRSDWRSFRDAPSGETLSELQRRSRRFSESLRLLAQSIDAGTPDQPSEWETHEPAPPRERPAPRAVISASRDLDAKVWEAARRWKGVLEGDRDGDLEQLTLVLLGSVDRLSTLIVALGGGRPGPSAHGGPDIDSGSPHALIERTAAELEGMLWRLQSDWQQLRRAPNQDRLRLLMGSFEAAAQATTRLRHLRDRVGASSFQRALRVGRQLTDGVGFLPYRDPFTGVYNREGFDTLAGAELKRCRRYGRSFGLLILEISAPDLAGLQRSVATARAELREYDLIARYVDDLILIGVPEGGAGATRRVASRVLKALRAGNMGPWFRRLSYSTLPEDGSTLSGLIQAARERLQP